jgi:hypothetical protein
MNEPSFMISMSSLHSVLLHVLMQDLTSSTAIIRHLAMYSIMPTLEQILSVWPPKGKIRMTDNSPVPVATEVTSEFWFKGTVMNRSDGVNHCQSNVSFDPVVASSETTEMMTSVLAPRILLMATVADGTISTH